jgi:hypothetical protein
MYRRSAARALSGTKCDEAITNEVGFGKVKRQGSCFSCDVQGWLDRRKDTASTGIDQ